MEATAPLSLPDVAASGSPPREGAVVLIGFMGAGKSSAARVLAATLGGRPVDTDELIEQELGMAVADWFAEHGEQAFREREERIVVEALARPAGPVIALGGGAVLSPAVREALAGHLVVMLDIDAGTAWRRAGGRRPLARDRERFTAMHGERDALYRSLADAVVPSHSRDTVRTALPAVQALRRMPAGTRMLWAHSSSGDYPVYIGDGLLASGVWPLRGARHVITDETVARLHLATLGPSASQTAMPAGETHKTLETAGMLLGALARAGLDHDGHVAALGGGVVGDVAGFCAAVYARGVGVVQVPTTLVAQVDSSLGGKTGVDLPEGKNMVGAFHQPKAVVMDPTVLSTLAPGEVAAGWAEAIKTALIAGGDLWERVLRTDAVDAELIRSCAATKLSVVAQDERDDGRRQVLNLGHTIGHAIETVTGYQRYRHGEAVGLGLLAALTLSGKPDLRVQVRELLASRGLPTTLDPAIDVGAVIAATARDKKRRDGQVRYVVVDGPGSVRHGHPVTPAEVRGAMRELLL